ncbi:unnamed protein product [Parascedosporium putredinis]|uniref:Endosomal/vacuolar adapter protein YPT35 n=1 Tax=Parascedosporium putredinis TaxID=1442378 RepID=A0A9P1HA24_9PEZI|nr:unnamed protein product [Parascedosporium putredinis]CAI8002237.1 unnamed protein product [Parascedosporium putredinis]
MASRAGANGDTRAHGEDGEGVETETHQPTTPSVSSPSSATSPPYWLVHHSQSNMSASVDSQAFLEGGGITMRDNESEDWGGRNSACWARSVEIPNYVVVNGSATNIGAFVVFNVRVETMNGSHMNIRKRYSEFDDLRRRLIRTFPNFEAAVPPLPPKSVISKFRRPFLEKRRSALQYFLNCILLNPEFSASPVLKEFLFA